MEIWTGFIVGFLGSWHCVGMCGPIALALPLNSKSDISFILSRILYNLGRVFTYASFGLFLGFLGKSVLFAGLQQQVSITLGVLILIYLLIPKKWTTRIDNNIIVQKVSGFVRDSLSGLVKTGNPGSYFVFGIINGFLPCGFVYLGLAGAISTGDALSGAAYMALFGLGTFPVMFIVSAANKFFGKNFRFRINKLLPYFAAVLAIMFILRGLNLGIPFLSPKIEQTSAKSTEQPVNCH